MVEDLEKEKNIMMMVNYVLKVNIQKVKEMGKEKNMTVMEN